MLLHLILFFVLWKLFGLSAVVSLGVVLLWFMVVGGPDSFLGKKRGGDKKKNEEPTKPPDAPSPSDTSDPSGPTTPSDEPSDE